MCSRRFKGGLSFKFPRRKRHNNKQRRTVTDNFNGRLSFKFPYKKVVIRHHFLCLLRALSFPLVLKVHHKTAQETCAQVARSTQAHSHLAKILSNQSPRVTSKVFFCSIMSRSQLLGDVTYQSRIACIKLLSQVLGNEEDFRDTTRS
jgi:hypothetical protein